MAEDWYADREKFFLAELTLISERRVSKPLSMNTGTIRGIYVRRWRFINEILASRIYLLQEKTSIHTCIGETSSEITGRGQTEIKVIEHSASPAGLTNSQRQTTNTSAIFVRGNYKTVSGISSF